MTDYVTYKDFTISGISYAAGTIGTRGYQGTITSATLAMAGYIPIAFSVGGVTDSSQYIAMLLYTGDLLVNLYRASANAVSNNTVIVKVAYRKTL